MASRVGIFGGSFNPPHIAHLIIAESIREQFHLDHVLWIPNYIPPHKSQEHFAEVEHRLLMTQKAIEHNPRFSVSELEIERKGTSFTLNTVQTLCQTHPETSFSLIIGGDSLKDFMLWHQPAEIVKQTPLIVYKRPGENTAPAEAERLFPERISFASAPLLDISSTEIRQLVRVGKSIRYLVPEPVRLYIQQHRLYL